MIQTERNTSASVISPMLLADRLLTLAELAADAGFRGTAERLVRLAYTVFDEKTVAPKRVPLVPISQPRTAQLPRDFR